MIVDTKEEYRSLSSVYENGCAYCVAYSIDESSGPIEFVECGPFTTYKKASSMADHLAMTSPSLQGTHLFVVTVYLGEHCRDRA